MSKNNSKCNECVFNDEWVHFQGCPFAYEQCDGKKMFKPKNKERTIKNVKRRDDFKTECQ